MPDKCWSVLSAERSAASMARALPSSRINTPRASIRSPSLASSAISTSASSAWNIAAAISSPATVIGSRAMIAAVNCPSARIVAAEVTSPPIPRSSAKVPVTNSLRLKPEGSAMAPASKRVSAEGLVIQEDEELHVDREALGALLFDEVGDCGALDEMDGNVLIMVAAALADPAQPVRADQSEAFRQHARRGVEIAKAFDPLRGEAGFFLELLDRGFLDRRIGVLVADQPGRKLDAARAQRDPRLVNQDDLAVIFGENHDRADVARAARIFPFAALEQSYEPPLAHGFGGRQVVEVHSLINLAGASFTSPAERGKCSARTAPTRSIAATMPSPGRPARTSTSNAAMASPQVCASVTLRIASSATISARRSPIER